MVASDTSKHIKQHLQVFLNVLVFILFAIVQIVVSIVKTLTPNSWRARADVAGAIALVTGGGSGIGRLTALRLARLQVKVVVWDVNESGIEETVKLIEASGGYCKGYKCDLCNKDDVYKVAKQVIKEVGEVSILINNAGVVSGKSLLDTPDELIKRTFEVNVIAHFWTTKAFLPGMMKHNKGHIVTIASMAGHVGMPKLVDYCSSKYAAVGFDESLRIELRQQGYNGIHTTCICPYFIQSTGMFTHVDSVHLPRLSSNEVADRIVEATLTHERLVVIPKYMSVSLLLKQILPWTVFSRALTLLIPDAHPDPPVKLTSVPQAAPIFTEKKSNADVQLHHRVAVNATERQL